MAYRFHFTVTHQTAVTVSVSVCASATNQMKAIAYPVFSNPATEGTNVYGFDYPLKKLTTATAMVERSELPCTSNTAAGSILVSFTHATTFDQFKEEWDGSPTTYRFMIYRSEHHTNLPAYYTIGMTANTNVYVAGFARIAFPWYDRSASLTNDNLGTNVCSVVALGTPSRVGF
jgi:hypothetical protein